MKFPLLCIYILVFHIAMAYAADDIFDVAAGGFRPPTIPSMDYEQDGETTSIYLIDSSSMDLVKSAHVMIEAADGSIPKTLAYIAEDGVLEMDPSDQEMIFKADLSDTPGKDFYGKYSFSKDETQANVIMFAVGSVKGRVLMDDKIVRNAKVSIDCSKLYGEYPDLETDEYGSFSSDWIPVGQCTIKAAGNNRVGSSDIDIQQGDLENIDVVLKSRVSISDLTYYIMAGIVILFGIILWHIYVTSGNKQQKSTNSIEETDKDELETAGLNKRMEDILATLSSKEKDILLLLRKEGELNQSRIMHSLMIPKTTLVRILQNLETKNIVSIKKHGKVKKISLTDWILEKD